ncbi:matrixin family metalloprotease [Nannocystis pusilla]|uniref:matrixin family metalloprotease n=1 Tax=Nannocystis pusilla TaxID=889268 RepID=UPI003B7A3350
MTLCAAALVARPRGPRPSPLRRSLEPSLRACRRRRSGQWWCWWFWGFPAELVDGIEAALRSTYQVEVQRRSPIALPKSAWYAPRKRYRADALLEHLGEQVAAAPRGTRILGLTSVDISTSKGKFADWGVFGLGELGGTAAVVSGHRLWRKTKDKRLVAWRVTNTAVHEVGHVLGLDHCEEPRCVMLDAEGKIDNTDASTGGPGPGCTALLDARAPASAGGGARGREGAVRSSLAASRLRE